MLDAWARGHDVVVAGHGVAGVGGWRPTPEARLREHLDFVQRPRDKLEVVSFAALAAALPAEPRAEPAEARAEADAKVAPTIAGPAPA